MENSAQFQEDLVKWFDTHQRDLPWRKNKNPYFIWVSEVMLQQTKVDTVIPYFNRFIQTFPTVQTLANAQEEEVLKCWEGLGYYSRARNLHAGAKQIVEVHQGIFPSDEKLGEIKGIGPYTKGAILSIAFGKTEPAVDGNVMRVYARLFSIWDDIAKASNRPIFEQRVRETIDKAHTSSFNQGIMELGALICTPTNPKCEICPVQSHCSAYAENAQQELPIKSKKKPPTPKKMAVVVLVDEQKQVVVEKRDPTGLLANLWQFPLYEDYDDNLDTLTSEMKKKYGQTVEVKEKIMELTHVFSHIKWEMTVYLGSIQETITESNTLKKATLEHIQRLPLPVAFQKIHSELQKRKL